MAELTKAQKAFAPVFYLVLFLIGVTFIFLFEMGYLTAPELSDEYKVATGPPSFDTVKCPDGSAQNASPPYCSV